MHTLIEENRTAIEDLCGIARYAAETNVLFLLKQFSPESEFRVAAVAFVTTEHYEVGQAQRSLLAGGNTLRHRPRRARNLCRERTKIRSNFELGIPRAG